MTDPDRDAAQRLDVALDTIARTFAQAVYQRHRFRLDEAEIRGLLVRAIAERDRVEALRLEEVRQAQIARTRPQKQVGRGVWREEATTAERNLWDEDTRPRGRR